jgi:polysaccharide export outer membrane protein
MKHNSHFFPRAVLVTTTLVICVQLAMGQEPAPSISASVAATSTRTDTPATIRSDSGQYRIGPGDVVAIQIFNKAQLSREMQVDTRGMIAMPLIESEIQAACRTEKELAEEIARLYREGLLLKNPLVYVSVKDYQSQPVAVIGAVNSPGRFQLRRRVRLLELLVFHAGGPAARAGRKVQILSTFQEDNCKGLPSAETQPREAVEGVVTYDLNELLRGNKEANQYVNPGDIINIPAAEEVIIVGNVVRPASIPVAEPITMARAIAMVGGTLPNSKKDKIRVTRQLPGQATTTEFLVDLKAPDKSQGENFLLQGGDIVEVSTKSGFQSVLKNLANSVIPMISRAPITVIP